MDVTSLLQGALEDAGLALALLLYPERGASATLGHVNTTLARMLGQPRTALQGAELVELQRLVPSATQWTTLVDALTTRMPLELDLALNAGAAETWLGLRLTFPRHGADGISHAVLTGRDITEKRRAAQQGGQSQRLLASIFLRLAVPVAIVRADGEIMMSNPALKSLLGYGPKDLPILRVQDLTAAEDAERAQAARMRQIQDGNRYDMVLSVLAKGDIKIPVHLTSMLVHDGDRRLRVVTLLPSTTAQPMLSGAALPVARDKGELRAVSLAAFRASFGNSWERIAMRAMMKAEQIIRRRLGPNDIINRVDDHNFVVWFDSPDQAQNAQVLSQAVREIRLCFLTDFGEEAAAHVSATIVPAQNWQPGSAAAAPKPMPTSRVFEQMLYARKTQR